jgi:hypothetical protein
MSRQVTSPARRKPAPVRHNADKESSSPLSSLLADILELGRQIPPEEWDRVPRDGSYNLDHYLYGMPKKT